MWFLRLTDRQTDRQAHSNTLPSAVSTFVASLLLYGDDTCAPPSAARYADAKELTRRRQVRRLFTRGQQRRDSNTDGRSVQLFPRGVLSYGGTATGQDPPYRPAGRRGRPQCTGPRRLDSQHKALRQVREQTTAEIPRRQFPRSNPRDILADTP